MVTAVKRPAGETWGKVAAGPVAGQCHRASPRPYKNQGGSDALRRNGAARVALRLDAPLARPRRELAHLSILMQSGTNGTAGLYGAVFLGKNCPTLPWRVNAASGVAPRSLREH